jgi:hypothetical protein
MMMLLLMLNTFLTIVFWRAALAAFEQDANQLGWVLIFFSAFNFASLMAEII